MREGPKAARKDMKSWPALGRRGVRRRRLVRIGGGGDDFGGGFFGRRRRASEAEVRRAAGNACRCCSASSLFTYDVLISAGHEGRPASCAHFPQHHCNLGASGERAWTPVVADAATEILATARRNGRAAARGFCRKRIACTRRSSFTSTVRIRRAAAARRSATRTSGDARAAAAWRELYGADLAVRV